MSENGNKRIDFIEQLRKNWGIIVFIVGLILTWNNIQNKQAVLQSKVDEMKIEIATIKLRQETSDSKVAEISGDIKEINAKLTFISDQLKK